MYAREGLFLVCAAGSLMASSTYPIKSVTPISKQEVAAFNAKLDAAVMANPNAAASPLRILQAMPNENEGSKAYSWCAKKVKDTQICTYRLEGVSDDSIAAQLYQLMFKAGEASWKITKGKKAWRCQQGRGDSTAYHTKKFK
ncbi:hypothetical protein [uncultured Thiothrix sp.]|uniref:hypothetical protein n=1 Tax=uncultured Thiothrix sp. TaxID=223185 RepID=UPI00262580CD|nr:hypothetical protein [uncultured Thiothrix sp.]